jgi:hypothetical protein
MNAEKEIKHFPTIISICFVANFLLGLTGSALTDLSKEQGFLWAIANLFFMSGCILYSIKLADEKHFISSAGFVLLGIGEGIFYIIQSKLSHNESDYNEYMMGILALLPGLIFICWNNGFPIWLRILGLMAFIPFGIAFYKMWNETYSFKTDLKIDGLGYLLTNITGIFWSYYAIKPYKP